MAEEISPEKFENFNNVKSAFEVGATFEEIDFSEYQNGESSPSHDSHSSGVFSPVRLDDNDEADDYDELVHDADFDSSDQESNLDPYRSQRKVKRRTSSNVFTFKKNTEAGESQGDVKNDPKHFKSKREIFKWKDSASFSSSTEEIEARKRSPQKLHNNAMIQSYLNQNISSSSPDYIEENSASGMGLTEIDLTAISGLPSHKSKTAVDGLLFEIYDRYNHHSDSHILDSDMTELSTTSVSSIYVASAFENEDRQRFDQNYLETKGIII